MHPAHAEVPKALSTGNHFVVLGHNSGLTYILVGMGWPKVDGAAVASSVEPAKSVVDLTTSVADLEGTVTTRAIPAD